MLCSYHIIAVTLEIFFSFTVKKEPGDPSEEPVAATAVPEPKSMKAGFVCHDLMVFIFTLTNIGNFLPP